MYLLCLLLILIFRLGKPEQTRHSISEYTYFKQNYINKKTPAALPNLIRFEPREVSLVANCKEVCIRAAGVKVVTFV